MKNNPIIWVVNKFYIVIYCLFLLGSGTILYGFPIFHTQDYTIQSTDFTVLNDFNYITVPKFEKSFISDFQVNLQSIFSLETINSLTSNSFSPLHMIIGILVCFLVIQFLYTKYWLVVPLRKIRLKLKQISEREENYGDQIPLPSKKILTEVTDEINTMSSSLNQYRTDMDGLVNQRLAERNMVIERLNQEIKIYQSQNQLLKESKSKFELVVENPIMGIFQIDTSGKFSYTNNAFNRIFGFENEELNGKHFQTLAPDQLQDDINIKINKFLSFDETKGELLLHGRDGKEIHTLYNVWKLTENNRSIGVCGFLEDISLQKIEIIKLEERERLLYDFFKNLTTGIVYADAESRIIQDVNKTLLQMTGYTKNDIFGLDTLPDLMPEQYHIFVNKKINEVIESGKSTEFDITYRKKGGIFFPATVSLSLLKNNDYTYIVLSMHDITKFKQKEKEVTKEKKRLANYLETIIDSIIVTDIKGNSILANQSYLNLIGYPRNNLVGRNAMDTLVPVDVPKLDDEFNSELFTKGYIKDKETNIKTKKGKTIPVLYSAKVLNDNSGQPVNLVGIIRDNRQRKKEKEILRKISAQAEFTAKLLLTSAQPFALFSKDGKCYNCNDSFCSMTGYSKAEIVQNMDIFKVLTHPDWQQRESEIIQYLIKTGKTQRYEKECIRKDGVQIVIDSSLNLLPNNSNTKMYICGFMVNVTDQKNRIEKIKEDLNKKNNLLKKLRGILNSQLE